MVRVNADGMLRRHAAVRLLRRRPGWQRLRSSIARLVKTRTSPRSLVAALRWASSTLPQRVEPDTRRALVDILTLAACADGEVRRHELGLVAQALITCPVFASGPRLVEEDLVASACRLVSAPPATTLERLRARLPDDASLSAALRLAVVVVLADADVSVAEVSFLRELAEELGLSPESLVVAVETAEGLLVEAGGARARAAAGGP